MSVQLRGLAQWVRPYADYALELARYYGVPVTVTSVYRGWQEQAELRRAYEAGRSRWPANAPGDSAHNFGLAFDSAVPPEYQEAWDAIRRYIGFNVPGNDRIHAEVPNWRSLL